MSQARVLIHREWLPLAALVALLFVFFPKVATFREFLFIGDILQQFYPYAAYSFARILEENELPLWTGQMRLGYPLLAEGSSGVLFPTSWFHLLFPAPIAFSCGLLGHILLAGIGTYGFLRSSCAKSALSRTAALTGAAVYACSGRLLVGILDTSDMRVMAALPWCVWALYGLRQRPTLCRMLGCSGALALLGLAGKPDAAFQAVVALVVVAAFLAVQPVPEVAVSLCRPTARPLHQSSIAPLFLVLLSFAGALALVLSAVQWLPTLELLNLSARREAVPFDRWISGSLPPGQMLSFVVPWLFGCPYRGTYVGAWSFLYLEMYLGSIGFFLAVFGAIGGRSFSLCSSGVRPRELWPWLILAVAGVVLSLGEYVPGYSLLHGIPPLGYGRAPGRWLRLTLFGVAVLATYGTELLGAFCSETAKGSVVARKAVWALLITGILLAAAALIAFSAPPTQFPEYAAAGTRTFLTESTENAVSLARERRLGWSQSALMLALVAGTILLAVRFQALAQRAGLLLLAAFVLDQRLYLADINPTQPASVLVPKSPVIEFLQSRSPDSRFYSHRGHVPAYYLARTRIRKGTEAQVLSDFYRHVTPNCALLAGLNDAGGYGELNHVGRSEPDMSPEGLKTLASWGVRFVITRREELPPGANVVIGTGDAAVFEIQPGPYLEIRSSQDGALDVLRRESYYPGWVALLDGRRAAVTKEGIFQHATFESAGDGPPGAESLGVPHFVYDPLSFRLSLAVSLAGILMLAALAAVRRARPLIPSPRGQALPVRPPAIR